MRFLPISTPALAAAVFTGDAHAISPVTTCDSAGIGSVTLVGDGPPLTILDASSNTFTGTATTGPVSVPYCLVKVLVPQAISIRGRPAH